MMGFVKTLLIRSARAYRLKTHVVVREVHSRAPDATCRVGVQARRQRWGDRASSRSPRPTPQERLRRGEDLVASLQRDAAQPVEVVAEAAGLSPPLQIPVGGWDKVDVERPCLERADAGHRALLERPQQLGLHRERHLADGRRLPPPPAPAQARSRSRSGEGPSAG